MPNYFKRCKLLFAFSMLLFVLFSKLGVAQQVEEWIEFKSASPGVLMVDVGAFIWMNAGGELVRFNKKDGSSQHFNAYNAHPLCGEVRDMAASNEGDLWCTTEYGLLYFDGEAWLLFDASNTELPTDNVNRIAVDNKNHLWVTANGIGLIELYAGKVLHLFDSSNSPLEGSINDLQHDESGTLWIGGNKGLFSHTNSQWEFWNVSNSNILGSVDIISVSHGHLWLKNSLGLQSFDGLQFQTFLKDSIPSKEALMISADKEGGVWFTHCLYCAGGLVYLDGEKSQKFMPMNSESYANNALRGVLVDLDGKVWSTSRYGRLYEFDGQDWSEHYLGPDSAYLNFVYDIGFLSDQRPAILHESIDPTSLYGSWDNTLTYLNERSVWVQYYYYWGFDAMAIDGADNVWLKLLYDIVRYNYRTGQLDTMRSYEVQSQLGPSVKLNQLAVNKTGNLFAYDRYGYTIQTLPGDPPEFAEGVAIVLDDSITVFTAKNSDFREGAGITDIEIDEENRVWIATLGEGIWVYESDSLKNYNSQNSGLIDDGVYGFSITRNSSVWVAHSMGFSIFDGFAWDNYYLPDSSKVEMLAADIDGSVWLRSGKGLIYHYDLQDFYLYDRNNSPLPTSLYGIGVVEIAIDSFGNKWFATENGLYVYRKGGLILPETHLCTKESIGEISFTPNPTSGITHLSFSADTEDSYAIRMVSLNGSYLSTIYDGMLSQGDHCLDVDLSKAARGVYVVAVIKDGRVYASGKVVKM